MRVVSELMDGSELNTLFLAVYSLIYLPKA